MKARTSVEIVQVEQQSADMLFARRGFRSEAGKKKASTRAGLKNTGSNVSNVVPSTSEPQTVAFRELPGDDNSYQYRL
ncbi:MULTISPECIES: hypothetical protein [Serratia]|uniref:hypothetical protein n=1 Tax=Serratia TaxID=613 RepID=UPI0012AEBB15|nr:MULTISPECIES: hypothetical protein [Serratia]EJD6705602.1 hypothetical protein [Serratia marcescens]MBH2971597.1 hypothetical protein [Serratia marcescens]MBH2977703.1 hypothetical protein [Serratia marcescens]MBN3984243.1 hypothetical protein [Serratia marcescens]MBN5327675.1 hypothetical protein [Serratia marcescens]